MPIIAIEGPDKCGKSQLFAELKNLIWWPMQPVFVEQTSFGRERMHIAAELSLRELEMWEALYIPTKLYVCNRHVLITDAVYSYVYSRKLLRDSFLRGGILVVYMDVDTSELARRNIQCKEDIQNPEGYNAVKQRYATVLQKFAHITITPDMHPKVVLNLLMEKLNAKIC